ncbi:CHAD domain-containing protein [Flavihumibacter sp. R14]|nr:CHAD domain-containing protein [Flavihumibacter soli]
MKKAILKRLLEKDIQAIAQALDAFLATREQDALHQLRVQIKKLKALLVLFAINKKNIKLWKVFQPIRKIFHDAGLIRDAHIHLQLADEFGIKHSAFNQQQAQLMSDETAKFCEAGRKYFKDIKRTGKKLRSELRRIDSNHITNFYRSELDAIALTLEKREFNEEMHECRKQVKTLLYNQKRVAKVVNGNFDINAPYLNQVQEALGRWHDSILARDLFSTQLPDERHAINQLNRQISVQEKAIARISGNFWKKVTDVTPELNKT